MTSSPTSLSPASSRDVPIVVDRDLRRSRRAENFPVALRFLPPSHRRDLIALYDVMRTIDDIGDETPGDATADLDRFEAELRGVWSDDPPTDGVLGRLVPLVRAHRLAIEPFLDLIAANRQDQVKSHYGTWAELLDYCRRSADPVGRLVLAVFDAHTPDRVALSDPICTALQLLEHCQDVREDYGRGRIYLPKLALMTCGVSLDELGAEHVSRPLRAVIEHVATRAERMMWVAPQLVGGLSGSARFAVAGFAAGGLATAEALRRADYDVLSETVTPRRSDIARHAARLLTGRS